jgi:RND superfamily putative drug exporter
MAQFLYRLGRGAAERPRRVIAIWLAGLVAVVALANVAGGTLTDAFSLGESETQQATDLLVERFPESSGASARVVLRADDPAALTEPSAAVTDLVADLSALPGVLAVTPPTSSPIDPTIGIVEVRYADDVAVIGADGAAALKDLVAAANSESLQVEVGGDVVEFNSQPETKAAEAIGVGVAVIILLVAFGSVIAMGLPIFTALLGLGIGLSLITVVARFIDMSSAGPQIASMIGIAVGIDYALFIVTRHREFMAQGHDPVESAGRAIATSGSAVVFAGGTVMVSILGLFLTGIAFIGTMGLAAAITVAVAVLAAITLLPALLGWLGTRIDRWSLPGRSRRALESQAADAAGRHRGWARWSHHVAARPWRYTLGSLVLLLALGAPLLSLRLGFPDPGNLPVADTQRRAYDLVAEGFGPGVNGPLLVVVDSADPSIVASAAERLAADPGVQAVTPPLPNQAGDVTLLTAIPTTAPQDEATTDLVHRLRDEVFVDGEPIFVTGSTAGFIDLTDAVTDALPLFIGAVVLASFVLLMIVFRSLLVPLKAAIMNLLAIGAAYGVVVAVFQWGWLLDWVGLDETVPITSFVPLFMFAILFGLSMDYEVFLLSRIREEYLAGHSNSEAVARGLAGTARVITSAALIMIAVFVAFAFSDDPILKMFGIGLAVSVLVDATVVRMILVPSTMALLGDANWWLPGWLDRILPKVDLEGAVFAHGPATDRGEVLGDGASEGDDRGEGDDGDGDVPGGDRELVRS